MVPIPQRLKSVLVDLIAWDNPENQAGSVALLQNCAVNRTEHLRRQQRFASAGRNLQAKIWHVLPELVPPLKVLAPWNTQFLPRIERGVPVGCRLLFRQFREIGTRLVQNPSLDET